MQQSDRTDDIKFPEKGLLNLINQKLESGSSLQVIEGMLIRAGLDERAVRDAIAYVGRNDRYSQQARAEQNDFLPTLNKNGRSPAAFASATAIAGSIARVVGEQVTHQGLFSGRLRRKDFVIGILFFFGLGFIITNVVATWVQYFAPEFADAVAGIVMNDVTATWLLFVPLVFAPITLMVLSLITRRLHNLGLPGWMSVLYLGTFVSPFGSVVGGYAVLGFHFMLLILFIVLITVKGHPSPNRHGELPPSTGSIFKKVFGI
jgi:uncharacterized membrane protein YhaH (DUF805 family)